MMAQTNEFFLSIQPLLLILKQRKQEQTKQSKQKK
jgi:hypothetical protein